MQLNRTLTSSGEWIQRDAVFLLPSEDLTARQDAITESLYHSCHVPHAGTARYHPLTPRGTFFFHSVVLYLLPPLSISECCCTKCTSSGTFALFFLLQQPWSSLSSTLVGHGSSLSPGDELKCFQLLQMSWTTWRLAQRWDKNLGIIWSTGWEGGWSTLSGVQVIWKVVEVKAEHFLSSKMLILKVGIYEWKWRFIISFLDEDEQVKKCRLVKTQIIEGHTSVPTWGFESISLFTWER